MEEIEAIYCLILGRRGESLGVLDRFIGMSILEAVFTVLDSEEFGVSILKELNKGAVLPHENLAPSDWYNILDVFSRAQLSRDVGIEHVVSPADLADCRNVVDFAYWEGFWRAPDPGGQAHYELGLAAGNSPVDVIESIGQSSEAADKGRTIRISDDFDEADINSDFIKLSYMALLNREADEGGLSHHLRALQSGTANRRAVFADLLQSAEGVIIRKNRPGGEAIVWYSPLAILMTSPFIERSILQLYGEAGRDFISALRHRDIRGVAGEVATVAEAASDVYRGRPALSDAMALAIYENLV
ncbi:DUF4214 domain-containing protein [Sphingomonas naphthae]|uniref:DUF4214 domain-containing protein n=1 Tax=Sphingomonas naphthae TaxID=1813468 RepID=A0ABY7TSJ8_9SPHN|nr:DUF4214 domain-containing protein [Sphingomonas naphthae]WCT74844.1 DUF4214 domain-containing protein [Sphingomonas naphthae]